MNLLLLGGNSVLNRDWVEDVAKNLGDLFDTTQIQYYKHWQENKDLIDFPYEVDALTQKASGLKNYAIFAKSAGTLVTVKAILDGLIKPKFCVFVGIPINWAKDRNFDVDAWFANFSYPALVIQNSNDPACSFIALKKYLEKQGVTNFKLVELPGDSHHYPDLSIIQEEIVKYLYFVRS